MTVELVPVELPDDKRLPLWEHVGELRDRLISAALALFAATACGYFLRFQLWELAKRPLQRGAPGVLSPFAYTDLSEPFFSMMRLSFWTSVFVISPYLFYQVWAFVKPALHERERRMAVTFTTVTSACFIAGAVFAYFVAFPILTDVLIDEATRAGLRANLRPNEYLNLFLVTVLGTGVSFEAPVLFYFLARFGLVSSASMLKYWRESMVAILAVSAFLTPGDVIASTVLFGVVLLGLYFLSAGVVLLVERSASARLAAAILVLSIGARSEPVVKSAPPPVEVTIHSRGAAPGEIILISVAGRPGAAAPTGMLRDRKLSFYAVEGGGWNALASFDLDAPTGPASLNLMLDGARGRRPWSRTITVSPKAFPTKQLTVDDRFVRLSPADQARVDGEQARTKAIYAASSPAPLFRGRFVSPIPGASSARFGERRVFNGVPKDPHNGADLRAATGEPVRAPGAGRVVLAGDLFYSGGTVILDHGLGLFSIYAHLSRIDAVEGRLLAAGEVLGLVGATGRVTGPHLHWGVKLLGSRVDPFSLTALPLDRAPAP